MITSGGARQTPDRTINRNIIANQPAWSPVFSSLSQVVCLSAFGDKHNLPASPLRTPRQTRISTLTTSTTSQQKQPASNPTPLPTSPPPHPILKQINSILICHNQIGFLVAVHVLRHDVEARAGVVVDDVLFEVRRLAGGELKP